MTASDRRVSPTITLAVLSLGAIAYGVLSAVVIPALPRLQRDLHTSENGVAWLLTAYLLAASVGTSILGRLGDMFGKKRMLVWTLGILAAGTLMAAVTDSLALLIIARVFQGAAGGIFPLSFAIIRDEFPRQKVAGGIGILSATIGVGGGLGTVGSGVIIENLDWHWLFWIPLAVTLVAAAFTWRFVPESPVRVPGRVNWVAAALMAVGISAALIAVSESTSWGWGSLRTLGLLAAGFVVCAVWVVFETRSAEPLVDMMMMRIRGVWTTNASAFLLGAGMYAALLTIPQFAQLPTRTGFGFGSSIVVSGLYLLPLTVMTMFVSMLAGPFAARLGSRWALIAGSTIMAAAFVVLAAAHSHPYDLLIGAGLGGIGLGLGFSALGNLIVGAVPPEQTGIASGMNTVVRTIGGALGAQLAATLVAGNTAHGLPTVTGFTDSFVLAAAFLVVGTLAAFAVPGDRPPSRAHATDEIGRGGVGAVETNV